MLIKTCFQKTIEKLEELKPIIDTESQFDVLLSRLAGSFNDIEKYGKTIDAERTEYTKELIRGTKPDEILISESMKKDFQRDLNSLVSSKDNSKGFINTYYHLISGLLIYSDSYNEGCNICEGELFYYYSKRNELLIKECNTCGALFDKSDHRITDLEKINDIKPATRIEILANQ